MEQRTPQLSKPDSGLPREIPGGRTKLHACIIPFLYFHFDPGLCSSIKRKIYNFYFFDL
uniref:Uncharacterized protein n=1 Tax=Anguilla anguilla TaxID=7936 RepID=A0A0E9TU10_ANGAN